VTAPASASLRNPKLRALAEQEETRRASTPARRPRKPRQRKPAGQSGDSGTVDTPTAGKGSQSVSESLSGGGTSQPAQQPVQRPAQRATPQPSLVSSGGTGESVAGVILAAIFWTWVAMPFLNGGVAGVRNTLRAKFLNKAPDGTFLP
jgi:hypothetical protein